MTKRTLARWFAAAVVYFVVLIAIGTVLSVLDPTCKRTVFGTFRDLVPLQIAIPAAWLAYCCQRRFAYLQQLRALWTRLVEAIQAASQYTASSSPTQAEHARVLAGLSMTIEEVRSLFANLDETDLDGGYYPFEPIKDIYGLIEELGFGADFDSAEAGATRTKIHALWKDVRRDILTEFDRETPPSPHSHWLDPRKAKVYDDHGIGKKPT